MEKKTKKQLTEFEKKYVLEEVKKTKEFNEYLATTNFKVATYKKPQKNGDKQDGNK